MDILNKRIIPGLVKLANEEEGFDIILIIDSDEKY